MSLNLIKVICAILLISSCAQYPNTATKAGSAQPTLAFQGFPTASTVVINGKNIGSISQYDGVKSVLVINDGTHDLSFYLDGRKIFTQQIFIDHGESRIITMGHK